MIKLFISDIDGCISTPFKAPNWDLLSQIRRLNQQSKHDMAVPPMSICSGRPFPYVEAVAQWLGIDNHVVFESAGIYELSTNDIQFLPAFDEEAERQVRELKQWLRDEIVPLHSNLIIEFTKRMDAGIIHLDTGVIDEIFPRVVEYVDEHYPKFEVHRTDVSINIILAENNKQKGIQSLCNILGLETSEVAYIGDSSGDIPGLKIAGRAFAPLNASCQRRRIWTLKSHVLMAYRRIIHENRRVLSDVG